MTFPLLWIGGLITSTDAGMAVPDWPGTYGYNMFLYPWQTWLFGPWDLFIEHGHRLLASLVGLVTIAFLVVAWRRDERDWVTQLGLLALILVIGQGVLGGVRVLGNERFIAMLHGCTGPLFFSLSAVLVAVTSRAWRETDHEPAERLAVSQGFCRLAAITAGLAYIQLTLGASMRHVSEFSSPWTFAMHTRLHLMGAAVVGILTLWLAAKSRRQAWIKSRQIKWPRRIAALAGLIVVVQITLGVLTWLSKYAAPRWASGLSVATMEANVADGWAQTHIVTAHSATGSLLIALLTVTAVMAYRIANTAGKGSPDHAAEEATV